MLVKIVGNSQPHHYLALGSIAIVLRKYSWGSLAVIGKWTASDRRSVIEQTVSPEDTRRIPHNKANLRAFAKQQKHFYKKAK